MAEESQNDGGDKGSERKKAPMPGMGKNPKKGFNFYWIYAVIGVILISITLFDNVSNVRTIPLNEFKQMANRGHIDNLVVLNNKVVKVSIKRDSLSASLHSKYKLQDGNPGPHYQFSSPPPQEFEKDLKRWEKEQGLNYNYVEQDSWARDMLGWLIPIAIMIAIWVLIMRRMGSGGGPGGQIFNIGKSKAQLFDKAKSTKVTFNDVAGLAEAKEEVGEIVDFLINPKKYTELGAKIPKGALLVGPPGTGKTLLAKAVAGEAQVPFFSLSGSDFVEMFVGVGASRVRDLFKQAKEKAPSIIFIDEIDAIGRARGKNPNFGSNDERENTLNQLLTEMDGFGTNSGVIILAATNRADILDRALLRAGRFDRQIYADMPDLNERKEIFLVHLKPVKVMEGLDTDFLARQTPGFSGADIANICNEAALIAARKKKTVVEKQDFLDAVDRIIGGLEKKNKIITAKEKKVIAFHEAGHATVSWLLEHASPLVKVTIVPRGQSLGAAWYLPEERQITTTAQILDEMCATMGGRASEEVTFGEISTGALSDLEKVTKQAHAMVTVYGLNARLGNVSYYDSSGNSDYTFMKPYSEQTAQVIDEEVSKLIESAYSRAKQLLSDNKENLEKIAKLLLEREVIFKEDLEEIMGKRPFEPEEIIPIKAAKTTVEQAPTNGTEASQGANGTHKTDEPSTPSDKSASDLSKDKSADEPRDKFVAPKE